MIGSNSLAAAYPTTLSRKKNKLEQIPILAHAQRQAGPTHYERAALVGNITISGAGAK